MQEILQKAIDAVRADREESATQKFFSNAYYALIRRFAIRDYPSGGFDFFLADRKLVDIVNAAGDLTAWGYQPNGKPWTIGIADPNVTRNAFSYLELTNTSIATSGNYEKFVLIEGKKYSHTIDPKSGYPVTGIKSVTIISPNAEIADAMATPVMIMGIQVGIDMINQLNGIECIIIDDADTIHTSSNVQLL